MRAGVWATLGDVRMTAALEGLGFDWVGIDAQHGHHDDRSVRDILSLRREPKATILVRVAANDPTLIGRALDAGADGVIVPTGEHSRRGCCRGRGRASPAEGWPKLGAARRL